MKVESAQEIADLIRSSVAKDRLAPPATAMEDATLIPDNGIIPIERYTSQDYYRREIERLWHRTWQVAGWEPDIPSAGDIMLYDVADIALIIVRQADGSLRAFHNSCPHRGMRIVDQEGSGVALRCPFHGLAWAPDGRTTFMPAPWDFTDETKASFCLREARVDTWQQFIFVNIDPAAPPLADYLGAMPKQWDDAGWTLSNRYKATHIVKRIPANWKIAQEAFMEGLHLHATHGQSILPTSPGETIRADVYSGGRHFTFCVALDGVIPKTTPTHEDECRVLKHFLSYYLADWPGHVNYRLEPGERARDKIEEAVLAWLKDLGGGDLTALPTFDLIDFVWYNVFPNFMPWPTLGYPLAYWFRPNGPNECTMDIMMLLPFAGERPPSAPTVAVEIGEPCGDHLGAIGRILDEDMANMARVQRGCETSPSGEARLSLYQESRIRHFHQTMDHYLETR